MALRRILVTGARGMLGRELMPWLKAKGYEVFGTTSDDLNLLEAEGSIIEKVQQFEPEVIVHTAAYTNVDESERNPDLALAVNKDGTRKLALAAKACDAILAMISTDYVFDGAKGAPYTVDDRPNPVNHYGLSKYYGELSVRELMEDAYIIRTSWLYGLHGKNFVHFVLDSARQGREVSIVDDQMGSPTWTGSLCHMIEAIITSGAYGTYHASDRGAVSRYEQAQTICKVAGLSTQHIKPIHNRDFPQAARRPDFTALDPSPLEASSWETALHAYWEQYRAALHA